MTNVGEKPKRPHLVSRVGGERIAREHIGPLVSLTTVKDQNIRPRQKIIKISVVAVLQREERNMLNSFLLFQL